MFAQCNNFGAFLPPPFHYLEIRTAYGQPVLDIKCVQKILACVTPIRSMQSNQNGFFFNRSIVGMGPKKPELS
jgi:hypothetical protein